MSFVCRTCAKTCDRPCRALPDLCEECFEETKKLSAHLHAAREAQRNHTEVVNVPVYGAGEFVAKITKSLGFAECKPCGQRRAAMNQVDLSGPAFEVFKGLTEAIIHPEKVLEDAKENASTEGGGTKAGDR